MPVSELLDSLEASIPVEAFTREMAQIAAKIDADSRKLGRTVPFADLLIAATALHLGHPVGTRNLRHYQMIPILKVIRLEMKVGGTIFQSPSSL
jgi:predicted nucleic acid-binding protein